MYGVPNVRRHRNSLFVLFSVELCHSRFIFGTYRINEKKNIHTGFGLGNEREWPSALVRAHTHTPHLHTYTQGWNEGVIERPSALRTQVQHTNSRTHARTMVKYSFFVIIYDITIACFLVQRGCLNFFFKNTIVWIFPIIIIIRIVIYYSCRNRGKWWR